MEHKLNENETVGSAITGIRKDISWIKNGVDEIKGNLDKKYVTKEEFDPVKTIAFGLVGVIVVAVMGSLLALIMNQGGI